MEPTFFKLYSWSPGAGFIPIITFWIRILWVKSDGSEPLVSTLNTSSCYPPNNNQHFSSLAIYLLIYLRGWGHRSYSTLKLLIGIDIYLLNKVWTAPNLFLRSPLTPTLYVQRRTEKQKVVLFTSLVWLSTKSSLSLLRPLNLS